MEYENVFKTKVFNDQSLQKTVHFNKKTITSSNSFSFPLRSQTTSIRFKICILFLTFLIAITIGLILSLLIFTQLLSYRFYSPLFIANHIYSNNIQLFKQLDSFSINELDFNIDLCYDFYSFVCRKWLINHSLSPFEYKRSWLTERSKDIRNEFSKRLIDFSENYFYKHQTDDVKSEMVIDDSNELLSKMNELEQFYNFDETSYNKNHEIKKRQVNIDFNNYSQSLSNMFVYYHQCLHTSKILLIEQLKQLHNEHFSFFNQKQVTFSNLFEQMSKHPLLSIWNMNQINLNTQIIIHIQRQIYNEEKFFRINQIEQTILFENYLIENNIHLCYHQSSHRFTLSDALKQYNKLLLSSPLTYSDSSLTDDLMNLLSNTTTLPIIYSSIRNSHELRDFIQLMFDRNMFDSLNDTFISNLFLNFTSDIDRYLLNLPIFRSTIINQCQLYVNYYIRIRSINETKLEKWFDYILSSIIHIIIYSWPGDASYICLYSTIIRDYQFQIISYWNEFLNYIKYDLTSPLITVEIRLVDFFQIDSLFRFLFANHYENFCHLIIYKYGPSILPFISIFDENIRIRLKTQLKNLRTNNSNEYNNLQSNVIPNDCLTLLEHYYPFTLSSFYEDYISNQTEQIYAIAYELRDYIVNHTENKVLSSLQFHIKPERLKLFYDLSPNTSTIPYEHYSIENNYLLTSWNIIERLNNDIIVQPTHEFFEINGHHTIEQGIFLQPTIAELYSNETTRFAALLIIAHELGHALCPCRINTTEREYFADIIALRLIIDYQKYSLNSTIKLNDLKRFFILYGQSECTHINSNRYHVNRVVNRNEFFQNIFRCSLNQTQQEITYFNKLLLEICSICNVQSIH